MKICLSILLAKPTAGLLALTMAFVGCRYVASSSTSQSVAFKDVSEFKDFAMSNGIYYHSGNRNGLSWDNFYVADRPVTIDDFEELHSRQDCGGTPAWRGILWVCQIHHDPTTLNPDALGGKWRVWGNVLVAGDEELMDRIEELYR